MARTLATHRGGCSKEVSSFSLLSVLQILSIPSLLDEACWKPGDREPGSHRPSRSVPGALSRVQKDKEWMKAQTKTNNRSAHPSL